MGEQTQQGDIPTIAEERDEAYGDSWRTTAAFLEYMYRYHQDMFAKIVTSSWGWAWLMILNKLIRAVVSPSHVDNWRDIEGYARLVTRSLTEKPAAGTIFRSPDSKLEDHPL